MASSLLSAAKSFLYPSHVQTSPPLPFRASPTSHWRLPSSRKTALRVTAQKWEPSKVCIPHSLLVSSHFLPVLSVIANAVYRAQVVPQADRVLIRLEELPEVPLFSIILMYLRIFQSFIFSFSVITCYPVNWWTTNTLMMLVMLEKFMFSIIKDNFSVELVHANS